MKDTFYFSHDYNARSDEKIKKLIRVHGMKGYGVFWSLVEDLYNNANALRLDYDGIAYDLREDVSVVKSVIKDFDLFRIGEDMFGSRSIGERLEERNKKSESARKSAFKRWEQNSKYANALKNDAIALQTQSEGNAIKERKGKEKRGKEKTPFAPPTLEKVKEYFNNNGYDPAIAIKAWKGYDVANWHDSSGKPILNWKQKMINVWFRPDHLIRKQTTKLAM